MSSNLFARYIWLIDTLMVRPLSLAELSESWRRSYLYDGRELNRKTVYNHRAAIAENMGVEIDYDSASGRYSISEDSRNLKGRVRQIINIFSVNQALGDAAHLRGRILYEDIPSGQRFLQPIIVSMKCNKVLRIQYKKFSDEQPKDVVVEPYVLKIVEQRWYLTGSVAGSIRNYALDRILSLEETGDTFVLPLDFDAATYFCDFYGVYTDQRIPVADIRLRVSETQANYLMTLSLHPSQRLVEADVESGLYTFDYHLHPTPDFVAQILRLGSDVEVLSPDWLRRHVAEELRAALSKYD